jgi:hypothetical protein
MTDFLKENQGVRQTLINSDSLRNPFMTIDREREIKICRQLLLAERTEIEKDPSGADAHTRGQCLLVVSNQNLIVEVQNRVNFHTVAFLVRDNHPSPCDLRLSHFSKSILSQVPA